MRNWKSALPSTTDIVSQTCQVRKVPITEVAVSSIDQILRGLVWRESSAPDIARSPFNFALEHHRMITCYLRYEVRPDKLADFEAYGAMWLDLMPRFGGIHHGYFLPSEGESDVALAMFSFPSLAAYEQYRKDADTDPDVQKAIAFAKETRSRFRR